MIQINKRSIGICILLSIITCGIYGIYWMYLLVKNTRSIQKNTDKCTGEMLCLIFVPFYSLYWWYTRGEKVRQGFAEHDYNATGGGVVYLVLAIFGLSIVSMAIMQSDFNSLKAETHSEQRSSKKDDSEIRALIKQRTAERKEVKKQIAALNKEYSRFSNAAAPFLNARRMVVQAENYQHLDEISAQYEQAKTRLKAAEQAAREQEEQLLAERAAEKARLREEKKNKKRK